MEYLDINNKLAEQIFSVTGSNSDIYIYNDAGEDVFVKKFVRNEKERINVIKSLIDFKFDGTNALPKKIARFNKEERGYSCTYYKDAICFGEKRIIKVPHDLRLKATLQVENQMKFLHSNGFIVNDIRLNNHMFSPNIKDGFMIDFEDMILENNYKKKLSYYRFVSEEFGLLPPSKWEDMKKQFICNLSLMLLYNFEYFIKINDEWDLLECLKEIKEIHSFAKQLFSEDAPLYFSEVIKQFEDEEKVLYYQKILEKSNIKKLG